uniref:Serine/threonine-protein phosphatase n=1 Tax=Chromera velia CCMP2878 TaxID=1169474 RepID=A0A0G4GUT8_9ALVE|eukprot:Cvel_23478.t1-p1 / transcript=Cvel_23478.t1 / gene=Cvel_23478 / organism=Chromera_velia_CCMP2878 / gene_product=Serine/threonine-protein phosphatase BSL1, putative / transcript_product=Serine/threonine-protein phosphatase BSL1, putative / location=Cvel_scaffold2424:2823-12198(+) / protein_length=842 / sequence_SO=supercontig / SO=protein_coding / is_pseudo=false
MTTMEDQAGEVPLPRFGHTTTLVGGTRVVLFGGATGDAGRYTITADTYVLDVSNNIWERTVPEGQPPSPRAAHAAACVDQFQLVIYGGATGGGSLSPDELYLLDFRQEANRQRSQWMPVPVQGPTPGRRYGHSLVFHKPNLIVFGGNNGTQAENDIWHLDVERAPFTWAQVELQPQARKPHPRVYHSAEVCREGPATGMMVVFGGRTADNRSLNDTWGLRQHRDGRWDWVEAPGKKGSPPDKRFQHSSIFVGSKLLIIGGRGDDVARPLPTAMYDTENCEWTNFPSIHRFRHSSWSLQSLFFAYGGFDHRNPSAPTNHLQVADINRPPFSIGGGAGATSSPQRLASPGQSASRGATAAASSAQSPDPRSTAAEAGVGPASRDSTAAETLRNQTATPGPSHLPVDSTARQRRSSQGSVGSSGGRGVSGSRGAPGGDLVGQGIRMASQVYISFGQDFTNLVRKVSIEKLSNEAKKLAHPVMDRQDMANTLADSIIGHLLRPQEWETDPDPHTFFLDWKQVSQLCDLMLEVMKAQPMVLKLRAAIKVFGDIHGQYGDLMRLFARYGCPLEGLQGDIDSTDYLFLGDYVDRGSYSLETICLLFALKLKHPNQVHLLRGNHEDPTINHIYGFSDECRRRLREDPDDPESCWMRFNNVFEFMPVGALIEDKILCIHGGIGGSINSIDDIAEMSRPLRVAQVPQTEDEQKVTDLLWSDPTDSDNIHGVVVNETRDPDGGGRIVKYGPDRVHRFLEDNKLQMIVRAHECVMDGFERFAGGKLITLFSATDYCGHHRNAGALLFIGRNLTIVPKIISPMERPHMTWDQNITQARPPTPPRPVPRARGEGFA